MGSKAGISYSLTGKVNISGRNRGGNKGWTGTSVGKSVREEALEDTPLLIHKLTSNAFRPQLRS